MCWSGDYLCWQRWNHQFTSGFNTKRILLHTRIPTSRSSRRRSLLGWDLLCVMIKRRQISSVSTEQYFEMVWWVSWKDAGSDIPGSGQIHFKSEWSVNETVESARSWFFGTKPNEDRGRRTPVQSMILPDSSDQSLLECATEPVMTWTTDLEIQQHHAESIHYIVLIKILWSRSGHKITQRSDLFLRSTLSVILTFMELKFRSPLHLETTPMFGWSYPEAQIATWMSYDTRIQNILQETLKKPIMGACKKLMRNNRLLNRDLNAFLIWWPHSCSRKEMGRHHCHWVQPQKWVGTPYLNICWKMGTSRKSPWQRSRWSNSLEIDTSEAEICVLEASRRYLHWQRLDQSHLEGKQQDTISVLPEFFQHLIVHSSCSRTHWEKFDRTRGDGSCRYTFLSIGNNSYFTEDAHSIWSQSWRRGSLQGEEKAEKDDKLCSSLPWIPGETRLKNFWGDVSKPRKVHYKT